MQRFSESAALGLPGAYREWLAFFGEERRRRVLDDPDPWALEDYERVWSSSSGAHALERLLDLNLRTYLVDDLLVKADRMSMAHGLEVRSPFLDIDLLELALSIPAHHHLKAFDRKRVLKAAVADLLPAEILRRRKRGFAVPLDRWFREDLASYVTSLVGAQAGRVRRHLVATEVDALLAEHLAGKRDHGQALWALLTLELFLRREGW
jgi:asparagine synthase (glutamine-hydrolysing)